MFKYEKGERGLLGEMRSIMAMYVVVELALTNESTGLSAHTEACAITPITPVPSPQLPLRQYPNYPASDLSGEALYSPTYICRKKSYLQSRKA
jgi:hypothetical protein